VSISLTFNFSKAYTTVAIMPEKEEMKMKAIHSEHINHEAVTRTVKQKQIN
jgi:hypothetical protein